MVTGRALAIPFLTLSLVFLAEGAWMATQIQLKCLLLPFIDIVAACILSLSVAALVGICRKLSLVFRLYRIGLFVSIIALLLWFTIPLFVQTRKVRARRSIV